MSRAYTSSGKRRSSMTHATRSYECTCGLVVTGNGGKSSHRKKCSGRYLSSADVYAKQLARFKAVQADTEREG